MCIRDSHCIDSGDWLAVHPREGQTFGEYKTSGYNEVTAEKKTIYVNPLQEMDKGFIEACQKLCAAFYYPLNVKVFKKFDLKSLPVATRINDFTGKIQYNGAHILKGMVKYLPGDAYAMICVLLDDIYNLDSWNFVFGIANLKACTDVFSFARYDPTFFELTPPLKVMVHKLGHMFGLMHCIYYACIMNGANHLEESDRNPLRTLGAHSRGVSRLPAKTAARHWICSFREVQKLAKVCEELGGMFKSEGLLAWLQERVASIEKKVKKMKKSP
eukprot:TRINITY_DN3069_c0_g8_i1.p1 TRINITY_DN3069_c0_g8~~TRINITY_DN3069_c0_g8_i1.p1  ORF type:complete len:272 (+),score=36.04 TRINITY_DN3069_c0_g8_i1:73-888(+)